MAPTRSAPDPQPVHDSAPVFRTGIAARLAGIPVETLRVWERRYQVVGPRLSPRGHRLYSAEDVSRLALIRQLVDLGSPIGAVAGLTLTELRGMWAAAHAASAGTSGAAAGTSHPVRLALVGEALSESLGRDAALRDGLDIVATCAKPDDAADALRGVAADVLAIELPTLLHDPVPQVDAWLRAAGARLAVVAYCFGPAAAISALRERGHLVVRAPLGADELERLCRDAMTRDATLAPTTTASLPSAEASARRFDDRSLARIARSLTTLYCECPRHVVDLLLSLGTFERYSAQCANRSPADAVLHRYLERVAGSARAMFEDALVRLAKAEGLSLPDEAEDRASAA
jgi:hypothetical protein